MRVRDVRTERNLPPSTLVLELDNLDLVISAYSRPWPPQEMTSHGAEWRAFVEGGGVLVIADAVRNPSYEHWLAAISPELSLPADLVPCGKNRGAIMQGSELTAGPSRLALTAGEKTWRTVLQSWVVAARTVEGLRDVVCRRFGTGIVAAVPRYEQVGFDWDYPDNLALMRR